MDVLSPGGFHDNQAYLMVFLQKAIMNRFLSTFLIRSHRFDDILSDFLITIGLLSICSFNSILVLALCGFYPVTNS